MISFKDIAVERGLDEEDVIEFLNDFVDYTNSEDLPSLQEALDAGDHKTVRLKAHSIKGAALNLNLEDIASYAEKIEKKSAAEDLKGVQELLEALTGEMKIVSDFLKSENMIPKLR
ncbi:MAG: Hpt domain-containing protein [Desulfomonile sp.]